MEEEWREEKLREGKKKEEGKELKGLRGAMILKMIMYCANARIITSRKEYCYIE